MFYLDGNVVEGRPQFTARPEAMFDASADTVKLFELVTKPFATEPVPTTTAALAYADVLQHVGASLPKRDTIDAMLVEQVRKNEGKLIDSQTEVGGWPVYPAAVGPIDTDNDGMPDEWERKQGLNPTDNNDALKVGTKNNGYTNLEVYLNQLVPKL